MATTDTVELLRQCDAGITMGVASIEEVLEAVADPEMKRILARCKEAHQQLGTEVDVLLARYHEEGKEPNPVAKGMSWLKTNVKMAMEATDQTAADLITDGCNMGVKSLSRYLNEYGAAEESAKSVVRQLIRLEEQLAVDLRGFL